MIKEDGKLVGVFVVTLVGVVVAHEVAIGYFNVSGGGGGGEAKDGIVVAALGFRVFVVGYVIAGGVLACENAMAVWACSCGGGMEPREGVGTIYGARKGKDTLISCCMG